MSKTVYLGWMMLLVLVLSILDCAAVPPAAAEFYGSVVIDGEYAPIGTQVAVYDSEGILCGKVEVRENGEYGFLSCSGDDTSTIDDEGAVAGEMIVFVVGDTRLKKSNSLIWQAGAVKEANLVVGNLENAKVLLHESGSGLSILFVRLAMFSGLGLILISLVIVTFAFFIAIENLQKRREATKVEVK